MKEEDFKKTLEEIGQKLLRMRKEKGYTSYEDFTLDFDMPRVHYWRIEKGKANFTFKTLSKVLEIHNLTIEEFFCQKEDQLK